MTPRKLAITRERAEQVWRRWGSSEDRNGIDSLTDSELADVDAVRESMPERTCFMDAFVAIMVGTASGLLREHESRKAAREIAELLPSVMDGHLLGMSNYVGVVLRILREHAGEAGDNEGAVDVLRRLVREAGREKSTRLAPVVEETKVVADDEDIPF